MGGNIFLLVAAQEIRSPAPQSGSPAEVRREQVTWLVWDEERMKEAVGVSL